MTDNEPMPALASASDRNHLSQQAGSELAQELALISSALFTQLMPGSADHALSGVPGLNLPAEATGIHDSVLLEPEAVQLPPPADQPPPRAVAVPTVSIPPALSVAVDERPSSPAPAYPDVIPLAEVPSVEVPSLEVPSLEVASVEVASLEAVSSAAVPSLDVWTVDVPSNGVRSIPLAVMPAPAVSPVDEPEPEPELHSWAETEAEVQQDDKTDQRSMLMLDEIGFLDEDS